MTVPTFKTIDIITVILKDGTEGTAIKRKKICIGSNPNKAVICSDGRPVTLVNGKWVYCPQ